MAGTFLEATAQLLKAAKAATLRFIHSLLFSSIAFGPMRSSLADSPTADQDTGPLEEITVTATRHEETLSKVPISNWAGEDASTLQYDPADYRLSSTHFASLRGGVTLGKWQLEAFCDNLTDTHTITNYAWSINPQVPGTSRLQTDYTFRPRTIGLTFIYHSKPSHGGDD